MGRHNLILEKVEEKDKIKVITTCPECKETIFTTVNKEDVQKYIDGAKVQVAFPYLSPEVRERFITGICGYCWTKIFGYDK